MATVIAARLQLQDQVDEAINVLINAGFARENIAAFYVNPPGQHATYPIGGDRYESPGAKESGKGAVKGAAVAAAAGAALGAGLSPVGAAIGGLVGAHVGSFAGTLSHTKEKGEGEDAESEDDAGDHPIERNVTNQESVRRAGMLIAVAITDQNNQDKALTWLHRCGATDLEKTEGEILNSDWRDFDPLSAPHYL